MSGRLRKKVAIITGAGTGVGEAIVHKFAREGARLVLSGLPGDPLPAVVEAITRLGGEAVPYAGDLSDPTHASACVRTAIERFGRLDVLVNNAAVFLVVGMTEDWPLEAFEETVRMNQRSAFLMTKYALPHLQRSRGNIVCTGSDAGIDGVARNAVYAGSKGWLHAFTKSVALEQAKFGVRANCVCIGPTDTSWTHAGTGPMDDELVNMLLDATPLGRRATVEEIANVFAFLASDEASFVTAALWSTDGGITAAKGSPGRDVPEALRTPPPITLPLRHTHDGQKNKTVFTLDKTQPE